MITAYDNTMSSLMCHRFRSTIAIEIAHWKRDGESTSSAAMSRDAIVRKRKAKGSSRRKVRTLPSLRDFSKQGRSLCRAKGRLKTENGSVLGMRKGVLTTVGIFHKKI
jgi:hypothetical protein